MSVFKIQLNSALTQEQQEAKKNETTQSPDTEVSEQVTRSEKDNMTVAAAEIPPEGAAEVPPAAGEVSDVKIKIDGPVGQIFTDALNKMLATESYLTLSPMGEANQGADLLQDLKDEEILQVYCYKADELNVDDVLRISDEITKHTERNYVLSFETAGSFPSVLEAAENVARLPNVSLFLSRKAAINHIQSKVRK